MTRSRTRCIRAIAGLTGLLLGSPHESCAGQSLLDVLSPIFIPVAIESRVDELKKQGRLQDAMNLQRVSDGYKRQLAQQAMLDAARASATTVNISVPQGSPSQPSGYPSQLTPQGNPAASSQAEWKNKPVLIFKDWNGDGLLDQRELNNPSLNGPHVFFQNDVIAVRRSSFLDLNPGFYLELRKSDNVEVVKRSKAPFEQYGTESWCSLDLGGVSPGDYVLYSMSPQGRNQIKILIKVSK